MKPFPSFIRRMLPIFLPLLLCACSRTPQLQPIPGDGVVLAFGDSITYGTGAEAGESYPVVLEGMIGRKVVNMGVPGETIAAGAARLPGVLDEVRPALMILCHGGNDLLQHLDHGLTADNISAMIRAAQERGVSVVLVGVPSPDLSLTPPPLYEKLAKQFAIPYEGKSLPGILGTGALKSDYIHPNAAGYRKLAESLAKLLRQAGAV